MAKPPLVVRTSCRHYKQINNHIAMAITSGAFFRFYLHFLRLLIHTMMSWYLPLRTVIYQQWRRTQGVDAMNTMTTGR